MAFNQMVIVALPFSQFQSITPVANFTLNVKKKIDWLTFTLLQVPPGAITEACCGELIG